MTDKKTDRFIVVAGSESGHCCFTHTVIDTAYGTMDVMGKPQWIGSPCECMSETDATTIARALNAIADTIPVEQD